MIVVRNLKERPITEKSHQTGFRERLLCERCEGRFSRYEDYAARHLLRAAFAVPIVVGAAVTLQLGDYALPKLFLLSLLWRVGVAEHSFFSGVDLGSHVDRLSAMLDAEDPGEPDDYGCLITRLIPQRGLPVDRMLPTPVSTRSDGHHGCLIAFRGFAFQFYVSRHNLPTGVRQAFLNKDGRLIIMWIRLDMIQPLWTLWRRCVTAIRETNNPVAQRHRTREQ
jgi:hypothetical protein